MTYKETLNYLFSRLPMYQREGKAAYKADIKNIVSASKMLGRPEKDFKSIHIAGTNGKGSTSHMLASILQEAGYKVGLYTSPHLKDFRERIKINGVMISKKEVVKFIEKNKTQFEAINLSFFEFTVALAFKYFSQEKIDIGIIEVGLGGRLDSTNIISPELSIITNIGLDHTNLLGENIYEIAKEKAGIIKQNTTVIIGRKQEHISKIFKEICNKNKAKIKYSTAYKYTSDLKGDYQLENCNTAVSAIKELQTYGWEITNKHIKKGLLNTKKNTTLLGRWQILDTNPLIICDTAHNEDGIKEVIKQINKIPHKQLHIILGIVSEKKIPQILKLLPKDAFYYFCETSITRIMRAKELEKIAYQLKLKGESFNSVKKAVKEAKGKANENDLIFIGGSTFIVAEVV